MVTKVVKIGNRDVWIPSCFYEILNLKLAEKFKICKKSVKSTSAWVEGRGLAERGVEDWAKGQNEKDTFAKGRIVIGEPPPKGQALGRPFRIERRSDT